MPRHYRPVLSIFCLLLGPAALTPARAPEPKGPPAGAGSDALPPGAVVRLGTLRFRNPLGVLSVAFSPDGKTLASADSSGMVRLSDAADGRRRLELPAGSGTLVFFTPDGKSLICCGGDHRLTVREAATGRVIRTFGDAPAVGRAIGGLGNHWAALSADGKMLAEIDGNDAVLWDVTSGKEVRRLTGSTLPVHSVGFSPDGKMLAAGAGAGFPNGDTEVDLWDVGAGKVAHRFAKEQQGWTEAVVFSPDGKTLASASPYETCLWDLAKLEPRKKLKTQGSLVGGRSIAFSADGKLLAVASGYGGMDRGFIHVWDPTAEKEMYTLRGHVTLVNCVAFAPDDKTLASGGPEGTVRLWDAVAGREIVPNEGHQAEIRSVAFSPDGTLAATASGAEHSIRLWSTADGAQRIKMDIPCGFPSWGCSSAHGNTLVFAPDAKTLACDDKVYDVSTGRVLTTLPGAVLAHSADGALVAGLDTDRHSDRRGGVVVWERAGGREAASFAPFSEKESFDVNITAAAFSPDARLLAVGASTRHGIDRDKLRDSVYLYDIASRKLLRQFRPQNSPPHFLSFSPDGELLLSSATWDQPVQLWRVADGQEARALKGQEENRHWAEFRPAVFSPDGKLIASAGKENRIILWEVATGQEVHRLEGHQGPVRALRFSPDGRTLLSGAEDTTALIWRLAPPADKVDLSPAGLDRLWDRLAGEDAAAAYRAAWALAADPDKAVGLFKKRLKPLPEPDLARVPRLLTELDADGFDVRQAAFQELGKLGPAAENDLREALGREPSPEVRKSVEMLLTDIHRRPTPPEELRQLRAIQTLEWIGTPDAAAPLEPLARGAPALRPARDAEAALRRLSGRKAKPAADKPAAPPRSEPSPAAPPRRLADLKAEATSLAYTADGKVLAAAAADGTALLLDAVTGKERQRLKADDRAVYAVCFAPDGKILATGGRDGKVRLWDAKTGAALKILEGHTDAFASVAFAPDGKTLASGSFDKTIRLWDPLTGQTVRKLEGHAVPVTSVAFSSDGKTLASGDLDSGVNTVGGVPWPIHRSDSVRLWDAATGREIRRMPGAGQQVAFSPDGGRLATAELATILTVGGEHSIVISGKDNTVGAGLGDAVVRGGVTITIWDTESGQSQFRLAGRGTAEARAVPELLAKGSPRVQQTRAARTALERLDRRGEKE